MFEGKTCSLDRSFTTWITKIDGEPNSSSICHFSYALCVRSGEFMVFPTNQLEGGFIRLITSC